MTASTTRFFVQTNEQAHPRFPRTKGPFPTKTLSHAGTNQATLRAYPEQARWEPKLDEHKARLRPSVNLL